MNWLLFILRFVFGWPAADFTDLPPIAVRPDGSTEVLPPRNLASRLLNRLGEWLFAHSFGRDSRIGAPPVDDYEHGLTRYSLGGDARRRIHDEWLKRRELKSSDKK